MVEEKGQEQTRQGEKGKRQTRSVLHKSLIKLSKGFKLCEASEEYNFDENTREMKLVKRKISTKKIPPDIVAIKYLLELDGDRPRDDLSNMTDSELKEEGQRLIKLLEKTDLD